MIEYRVNITINPDKKIQSRIDTWVTMMCSSLKFILIESYSFIINR